MVIQEGVLGGKGRAKQSTDSLFRLREMCADSRQKIGDEKQSEEQGGANTAEEPPTQLYSLRRKEERRNRSIC